MAVTMFYVRCYHELQIIALSSERLNDLPKITQLIRDRVEM